MVLSYSVVSIFNVNFRE